MISKDPERLEEALWVSCPGCDARPGEVCLRDPEIAEVFDFTSFRLHYVRVDMMEKLATMEDE